MATYNGGGFVADLGYNQQSALGALQNLQTNNWIDEFSVAVFIEFTVFSPSSSLFSVVKYLSERFSTGDLVSKRSVKTLTLYKSSNANLQSLHDVCYLLFMIVILFFLVKEISKIYHQRRRYFLAFWNWVELVQIATALCSVAMFFLKENYTSNYVQNVRRNPFRTSSADYIVLWSELDMYLLSFLIFIVTMKFLRLIRFNSHVCQMIGTLKRSVYPLVSFFTVFVASVLAYTQLGFLLFGPTMAPYSSFFNSLRAVLQMLLGGDMFFFELKRTNSVLGPLFVFLYTLTMAMILLNMFLAILNDSYIEVMEKPGYDYDNAGLGELIFAHSRRKVKQILKELTSFLRKPVEKYRKRKRKSVRREKGAFETELERLFASEIEESAVKGLQKRCPIASMESLTEITKQPVYQSGDLENQCSLSESSNIAQPLLRSSMLSVEELYDAKDDYDLIEVRENIREIDNAIKGATGGRSSALCHGLKLRVTSF